MGNCCSTDAAATVPRGADKPLEPVAAPAAHADAPTEAPASPAGPAPPSDADSGASTSPAPKSSASERVQTPTRPPASAFGAASPVDAPGATHSVRIGGYNLRYSYYSKRGYYPESRKKPNQDSYYCETHFAGDDQKAFFAVFDGHGQFGDVCSQFSAEQLPDSIVRNLEQNVGVLPALSRAHVETNEAMHEASFDDSMSGTTSISVLFCGNEIYVSNVGDSRAIIAQENLKASTIAGEANLVAKPLSIDQTPFRKDERERVKKCGARILTVDQVEGLEPIHENWGLTLGEEIDMNGDPPRIWHPYGQYPGTAFTRSIGDLVSEELGVTAEPEILCKDLKPHDRFIVIASDGVFEFLTSQNVVDIVKKFEDPSEACQALVEEAYNRWLQFEVRTDDITAICIFLDGVNGGNHDAPRESIFLGREVLDLQSMQRPVRGSQKSARRDTIVGTDAIRLSLTDQMFDGEEYVASTSSEGGEERSEEEIQWIKESVQENFLFNHLSDDKIRAVISVLNKVEVKAGDVVIRQGTPGDTFYLVESGEFEVRQLPDEQALASLSTDKELTPEEYGDIIHVYKSTQQLHPTFGELALIYSKPRAATVIAKVDGSLWSLDRLAFRSILMRGRPLRDVVNRLRQISILRPLTVAQTNLVAEEMKSITFAADQVILHEGMAEPGFFLIISGRIEATAKSESVPPLELKTFDYFGEIALVRRRSISQRTLRASEKTECLFIKRDTLEQAVGKLSAVMEKDKIRRARKDRIADSRKRASAKALVLFDNEPQTAKLPKTVSQIEIIGDVFYDPINTIRLVKVKGSSPAAYMTLRSVSKQAVYDASMQKHVCGERDIYVALYEKNALVPNVYGMNTNDTDIHLLYDSQIVGNLEEFLNGEAHGESFVRYYAAQVVMALEFLHSEGIVSRTVDPTNLMVDRSGNIRMLNLRLSKYVGRGRTYTVCGTPEYLSPEQIQGEGHNIAADYWALGVLMYELLCGVTPFSQDKKGDIEILNFIASFNPEQLTWPDSASPEIKDLISRLLSPEYPRRLGFSVSGSRASHAQNGCEAIKKHPFFAGTSWEATKSGSFAAPLEVEASTRFKEIVASESHQELNIGTKYSGDFEWLSGF